MNNQKQTKLKQIKLKETICNCLREQLTQCPVCESIDIYPTKGIPIEEMINTRCNNCGELFDRFDIN